MGRGGERWGRDELASLLAGEQELVRHQLRLAQLDRAVVANLSSEGPTMTHGDPSSTEPSGLASLLAVDREDHVVDAHAERRVGRGTGD